MTDQDSGRRFGNKELAIVVGIIVIGLVAFTLLTASGDRAYPAMNESQQQFVESCEENGGEPISVMDSDDLSADYCEYENGTREEYTPP